jgi:potassium/sodium efflux P-type ATPase
LCDAFHGVEEKLQTVSPAVIASLEAEDVFQALLTTEDGLFFEEVHRRLELFGPNKIQESKPEPLYLKLFKQFFNFFAILLWIAAVLAFISRMPELAIAIVAVIIINGVFSFWQEYKAERAAEELRKLLPYNVRAIREGQVVQVPASEVCIGDLILLQEGDRVPADLRLVEAIDLQVDASVLTGESKPVRKFAGRHQLEKDENIIEARNLCFAGTYVVSGTGKGVVYATGMNTEFGKIAALTLSLKEEPSPLQKEISFVTKVIVAIAISMGVLFYLLGVFLAGLTKMEGFIFAIGIIVANVPEGLLPTITLSLAMAVQRMARNNALVKKLSTVEVLGSATVICTDKTGTLTRNEMTVKKIWAWDYFDVTGSGYEPKGAIKDSRGCELNGGKLTKNLRYLLLTAELCNNSKLVKSEDQYRIIGDPTEGALKVMAAKYPDVINEANNYKRIREIPFNSFRKRMSVICEDEIGQKICFSKGAPDVLLNLCRYYLADGELKEINEEEIKTILSVIDEMSEEAYRVLAFAYRYLEPGINVYVAEDEEIESGLVFLGLVGMIDPPRPEVEEAVKKCRAAGIKIFMITGDYGLTARAIAKKIGIFDDSTKLFLGADLENLSDEELKEVLNEESLIFARVTPEHKLRIVTLLKDMGHIVAVTGDGVNDAPALKKADVGVAMGVIGTDVAREAADMILLDDNFASIVRAVEEGRAIFDNIRRFITYIFASNIPEIVPYLVFVLSGGKIPLPLTVTQILAVDVGTDLLPALALGAEPPESDVMKRKPRPRNERLLSPGVLLRAYGFLGILEAIACMTSFFYVYLRSGYSFALPLVSTGAVYLKARTMCLASIITSQIGNGFACRTTKESIFSKGFTTNRLYLLGIVYELGLISALIYIPFLAKVFGHQPLSLNDWLFLFIWPPLILLAEELRKLISRKLIVRKKSKVRRS